MAAAAFWTLFGVVTGLQVWLSMIAHGHSIVRMVAYYVLVWDGWLAISVIVVSIVRRVPAIPLQPRKVLVHALAAILLAIVHMTYWAVLTVTIRPFDRMTVTWQASSLPEIFFGRLPLELILYTVVAGAAHAAEYYSRSAQLEVSLMQARLHALELQIQPHFLFNTLNAISALVRSDQKKEAVAMIAGLSELLRYMLDHAGQQLVSLEDESRMLQRYLEIQRMRFPDRLTFGIDIGADVRRAAVPAFILQPLAENAVRHGIGQSTEGGVVQVRAVREDQNVRIEIFNSGTLREPGSGIGVQNTRERLRQLYGERQSFDLAAERGGVLASILLPWRELACEP
jgi:two-component system, LytTR family, sensor kinase